MRGAIQPYSHSSWPATSFCPLCSSAPRKLALNTCLHTLLQVGDIIRSYNIACLLDEYHPGSRQWMYDKLNAWLDACITPSTKAQAVEKSAEGPSGAAGAQPSRAFLLLADAGMGKSVFSGVVHTKLTVRVNTDGLIMVGRRYGHACRAALIGPSCTT